MSKIRQRGGAQRRGRGPGGLGKLAAAGGRVLGLGGGGHGRKRRFGRRGHGITKTELRGFNRVSGMLAKWGMVPRKMRGAHVVRRKR